MVRKEFLLPEDDERQLDAIHKRRGDSVGALLREAVRDFIAKDQVKLKAWKVKR